MFALLGLPTYLLASVQPAQARNALRAVDVDTIPAQIQGTVRDTAGRTIALASVRVDSAQWRAVRTDGAFAILNIVPGHHILYARAPGFILDSVTLNAEPGDVIAISMKMYAITELQPVSVHARANGPPTVQSRRLDWMEGFEYRRLHNIGGTFLNQDAIDHKGAMRMTELLRGVPGVTLHPVSNQFGGRDFQIVMRGGATASANSCPIQYYLDGHPFGQVDDIDRMISPRQISAIEVYPGASQVPEQFKGSTARCGVIALWSRIDAPRSPTLPSDSTKHR